MENITGHTALYCLLGHPVSHSVSPRMHNTAFDALGVDARYLAFDVTEESLPDAVRGLRAVGAKGWNLTMPCKTAMAGLCDELTPVARLVGAVNTVANRDGTLLGTTTDGMGWVLAARAEGFDVRGKRLVVLGAGGAGKSVLAQCAVDGAERLDVFCRRSASWDGVSAFLAQAGAETGCKAVLHDIADSDALRACLTDADLLLNTTPVGMGDGKRLIEDETYFHAGLVVSDLIYEPRETPLLRMARGAGLPAFNGMDMLLYQGAAAFAFWTGREMPVEVVRQAVFA